MEAERWATLFNTQDQKEGMQAFIEKRKPVYQGK
jgi:enoyl-CoA hydratase